MPKLDRDVLVNRVFTDSKNYPYGFSRSGDFSISESQALAQSGNLIAALVDGFITPEAELEHELLAAAFGKKEPQSAAEKAWVKYQKRINRPKLGNIYGANHNTRDSSDAVEGDDDIQIELDEG